MPYDSPFTAIRAMNLPTVLSLVTSETNDALSGVKALGQFTFTPLAFPGRRAILFRTTCWVSNAALVGIIQLYNVTDGEAVTGAGLTFNNTTPGQQTSLALTVGVNPGDIKPTSKVYEVRMSVSGTLLTDVVSLGTASLIIG